MTLQQHIKAPADVRRTLATFAFGATLALAAWGATGALAGTSPRETQSAVTPMAASIPCQTTTVTPGDAPVERPGSRRY
jgi:hypothetical protein